MSITNLSDDELNKSITSIAEAIKELSSKLDSLKPEESEELKRYYKNGTSLEFTLTTGGIIRGKIRWIQGHSIGIKSDSGGDLILYKQAISFIQKLKDR